MPNDIPLPEQIDTVHVVLADMTSVKRYTPAYQRKIEAMRAGLETLGRLQDHMDKAAAL